MAKTYCTCIGMRGERTARGGYDGCRASVQSYDGSIIISNYVDRDDESLHVRVGTSDGSSCYSDWNSNDFVGTFDEFKALLKLHKEIKEGKVSVVRHRDDTKKRIKQLRMVGFSDDEIEEKLHIRIKDYLKK